MEETARFPQKTSHRLQAVADVGFLAGLLTLAAAIETAASPQDCAQSERLAAEVRELARHGSQADERKRIL